jgi:hypothetical protein
VPGRACHSMRSAMRGLRAGLATELRNIVAVCEGVASQRIAHRFRSRRSPWHRLKDHALSWPNTHTVANAPTGTTGRGEARKCAQWREGGRECGSRWREWVGETLDGTVLWLGRGWTGKMGTGVGAWGDTRSQEGRGGGGRKKGGGGGGTKANAEATAACRIPGSGMG